MEEQLVNLSTKEKILEVATYLFSQKGHSATSVRDISKKADVNVASVNYHFKSKENLLFEVLKKGCSILEHDILNIDKETQDNAEEFFAEIFRLLLRDKVSLRNNFRMLLSEEIVRLENYGLSNNIYGPPGGDLMAEVIQKSVGKKLSLEELQWVVQSLFSIIVHQSIILASPICAKEVMYDEETVISRLKKTTALFLKSL